MIDSRLKTFTGIIKALILCQGSHYKNMAAERAGSILLDSKIKNVSRFLKGTHIDQDCYYEFMKGFIPAEKVFLSIDRTIWEFGKEIRNVLVVSVSYDKIAMPVVYKFIPYKGTCTSQDQIEVIEEFVRKFGCETIEAITGDREFDNEKFLTYLHHKNISYAIRVRKTNRIINEDGDLSRIEKIGSRELRNFETKIYTIPTKLDHHQLASGEYLSIVSSKNVQCGLDLYKRRWDIESAFKGCKTSGFKMEDTHITNKKRLDNFIKCIFIAYAIAIKTGHMENSQKPIKTKKTLACKAYSILQYGIMTLKQAYSASRKAWDNLIKTHLCNMTFNHTPSFVR